MQEKIRRTVEVVGTLAAEDEVTISSQADGAVRRVLADLGDRVKSGQTLVELDREKLQYNLDEQKAALARALTKYGATEPGHLPPVEETPDVRKAAAELAQAKQAANARRSCTSASSSLKQSLDDAETTLRSKQAAYDSALQNARNLRADIDASNATMKLADRQLRDAIIRAPFDGYVQKRMVSLGELREEPDAGDDHGARGPAEADRRRFPSAWRRGSRSASRSTLQVDAFPGKTFAGDRVEDQPGRQHRRRGRSRSRRWCPITTALLKPGTFARVHLATALVEQVLTVPYAAMQYRYGVYRVFTVNGDRLAAHELKTGDRVGDRMEILGGVKLGDAVALTDVDNLADGMKVTVSGDDGVADAV